MYAVIVTGGKQYKVAEGDVLKVEKLDASAGDAVTFKPILCVKDGVSAVGTPEVEGASVSGQVVKQARGEKILVFKYKAKKNVRKRQGHRQAFTQIKITKIDFSI